MIFPYESSMARPPGVSSQVGWGWHLCCSLDVVAECHKPAHVSWLIPPIKMLITGIHGAFMALVEPQFPYLMNITMKPQPFVACEWRQAEHEIVLRPLPRCWRSLVECNGLWGTSTQIMLNPVVYVKNDAYFNTLKKSNMACWKMDLLLMMFLSKPPWN